MKAIKIIPGFLLVFFSHVLFSQTTNLEIFNKGLENYYNGQFDKAISFFDDYIKSKSNDANGYMYRGLCYQSMKNFPRAIENFTSAINNAKGNSENYVHRGDTYFLMKNPS